MSYLTRFFRWLRTPFAEPLDPILDRPEPSKLNDYLSEEGFYDDEEDT